MSPATNPKLDLYLLHRLALVDYAASLLSCRAQAEDVVQEAWLRFSSRDSVDAVIEQPVGYLYRIVRNLAFDLSRRDATERRQPDGDELLETLSDDKPGPSNRPAPAPSCASSTRPWLNCRLACSAPSPCTAWKAIPCSRSPSP